MNPFAAADPRKGHGAAPSKPSKRGFEGFEGRDECHWCKIRVLSMWPSQPGQAAQPPRARDRDCGPPASRGSGLAASARPATSGSLRPGRAFRRFLPVKRLLVLIRDQVVGAAISELCELGACLSIRRILLAKEARVRFCPWA